MKTAALIVSIIGILAGGGIACAQDHQPSGDRILLTGNVSSPFVSDRGGPVYLQLSVRTPGLFKRHRTPLNVAVVLDRSGSMADGRKIDYAKSALLSLIDQLSSEDIFSLVIYDDVIDVVRPAGRLGDKRSLRRLINRINPRGSTNLGGGMIEGFRQARRFASREFVNRVVLLSDGLANQGITDPRRLASIARRERAHSISLTTMGVGLEYNENLMVALAESGGGSYYFIESPRSIAHILHREFESLSSVFCQNAILRLRMGPNVTLRDVVGYPWHREGNEYEISLGDLLSDATSEITVQLQVPEGTGSLVLAEGGLTFESGSNPLGDPPTFQTTVQYTRETAVIEKHRNMEVQAKGDVAVSTLKVEKAMEALDAGRSDDAAHELEEAQQVLSASPAAGSSGAGTLLTRQARNLDSFQSMIADSTGDTRRAKKAIQYENYKTQKNH